MAGASKSTNKKITRHGLWPAPITAVDVAKASRRFGLVQGDGDWVYWTEGRPEEKGRQALMRHSPEAVEPQELLPAPWSARSRVHEYGGGEFLAAGDVVYFVNDADQDVYELAPGGSPRRITDEPAMRFADFTLDRARGRLICVAERSRPGRPLPDNLLVAVALAGPKRGTVTEFVCGRDFYACPRLSPDGRQLAFVAWNLPDMPWDQSEILVCDLDASGRPGQPRHVAGGEGVAAQQPRWSAAGALYFVADGGTSGFGRLHIFDGRRRRTLPPIDAELGAPMWSFGISTYVVTAEGTVHAASAVRQSDGRSAAMLLSLAPEARAWNQRPLAALGFGAITIAGACLAGFESRADRATAIVAHRLSTDPVLPAPAVVRSGSDIAPASEWTVLSETHHFPGGDRRRTFALYYPPTNPAVSAPAGERPPALVLAHGGPTSAASRALSPRIQFYTSRGFAVLDVDYSGSTGYGRKYRERLDGQWGIADVADCAAAARFLARQGLADPARIAIAGGSAGGYTTLMALATTDVFAAGSSHYGISDLSLLMEHTHKFESGYLHRLLGTTPKTWKKVCRERSPITHIDAIRAPLILFQGLEDRVVPPEQSRLIAERLKSKGQTVELHELPGEGHGFRRAESIVAVLQAELAFLLRAMRIA